MQCLGVVQKINIGKSRDIRLPALPKCMITMPSSGIIAPADYATEALLKVKLQSMLVAAYASRAYLWPLFALFENRSEEAQYEDTALGIHPTRDGQYRFLFGIRNGLCNHKAMFSHRAINEGRVLIIDVDNQIWGTLDSDENLTGLSMGLLHTEKLMISDGSVSTKSPIYVCLSDNEELDNNGALISAGAIINQLERLTDVTIELTDGDAFAADGFYVDIKQRCDCLPVSGLALADFLMYQADGVTPQVISSADEDANNPGRYFIDTATAFVDGTLRLKAPSALTIKAYETYAPLAVDIP